jgi:hypothetical protein
LRHGFERWLVSGIETDDGLEAGQSEIGPLELVRVPTTAAHHQALLGVRCQRGVLNRGVARVEDLAPGLFTSARDLLDLLGVGILLGLLAQRLGEGHERLLHVAHFREVDLADGVESLSSFRGVFCLLGAPEQRLDDLFELAEPAAHPFE